MSAVKIVLIGAGSTSFGRGALADIFASKILQSRDLTISLVDLDATALSRMYKLAELMKEHYNSDAKITATTDRREVLKGANFVVTAVAQDRSGFWEKEYYIPVAYGFQQVFGENGGPGGAFHTLRSLHLMLPICQDMEELCPDALLLNFTNPESRICLGIHRLTGVRVVGLCHGPVTTLHKIGQILGRTPETIEITVGGINHFHWVLEMKDEDGGTDLYPLFRQKLQEQDWGLHSVILKMLEIYGLFTYPDPSHPTEYVGWAFDTVGPQFTEWGIGEVSRHRKDTVESLDYSISGVPGSPSYELRGQERAKQIQKAVDGDVQLNDELFATTLELTVPIIEAVAAKKTKRLLAANVLNNGAIANLPEDSIVEVPIEVSAGEIRPVPVGELPEGLAGYCRLQISIQNLLIEAYRKRSKNLLLQALLLEPTVDSISRAEGMMEALLRLERGYIPDFQ